MKILTAGILATFLATPAFAADVTYRNDIAPLWESKCASCHGAQSPYLGEFLEREQQFRGQMKGPRMDSYSALISFVGWPETGALMRRLDDGANTADRKPGNMYTQLGATEEERQKNLKTFKAWVGDGAWNLNRWDKKGDMPGITKEQLSKIKVAY